MNYNPYLISAEFDDDPGWIDDDRWVTAGIVDIGIPNMPKPKKKWLDEKLDKYVFRVKEGHPDSLNDQFALYICSPSFAKNPDPRYLSRMPIMLVQEKYDPKRATEWLKNKVESIGEISAGSLQAELYAFLDGDEANFSSGIAKDVSYKQAVTVTIPLSGRFGSKAERRMIYDLTNELAHAVLQLDGSEVFNHDFVDATATIYIAGPSADEIFMKIRPILKDSSIKPVRVKRLYRGEGRE